jgi:hypothetical protein
MLNDFTGKKILKYYFVVKRKLTRLPHLNFNVRTLTIPSYLVNPEETAAFYFRTSKMLKST